MIEGIKTDIVNYPYPWLKEAVESEGIRMAAREDIAAMKIAAITQRGSKKDFIDLYFLLREFTLEEILTFYQNKISDGNRWMAIKSLTYFDDADPQPTPDMFLAAPWEEVKKKVKEAVFAL